MSRTRIVLLGFWILLIGNMVVADLEPSFWVNILSFLTGFLSVCLLFGPPIEWFMALRRQRGGG